ncbi:hypothetical protein [Candidatus Nephthysia bennettiae]|uniref:DUF11 domain-containing protein n=1 Tax=Candidatus Nephthysia bennettiae TaxID=3127016 RepID=A0A934KA79_9BACT|nr:hypothetical protein [Candidatus Dormibacteraeota bacterium]MBJ7614491.1 hypothetical protein [Candidatus Dormibacteraeota bacterium]
MKTLKYVVVAVGVATLLIGGTAAASAGSAGVRPAQAAPSCGLQLTKSVNNPRPILGHTVTYTIRMVVKCNIDVIVTVDDSLPRSLAQVPPGEQLRWQLTAPAGQQVTRVFTVGASPPGADGCNVKITNTASAAAQLPGGEGAVAFATASVAIVTACVPSLPATGKRVA